jgi:hypothetical protein
MNKPLTFEQWKADLAPPKNDDLTKSLEPLHQLDYNKEYEQMLKREYQEYLGDFNGSWLL